MRARYYAPSVGRFLSADTWAVDVHNPVELNRYVYAVNNPESYIDPSGLTIAIDSGLKTSVNLAVIVGTIARVGVLTLLGAAVACGIAIKVAFFAFSYFSSEGNFETYDELVEKLGIPKECQLPTMSFQWQGDPGGHQDFQLHAIATSTSEGVHLSTANVVLGAMEVAILSGKTWFGKPKKKDEILIGTIIAKAHAYLLNAYSGGGIRGEGSKSFYLDPKASKGSSRANIRLDIVSRRGHNLRLP